MNKRTRRNKISLNYALIVLSNHKKMFLIEIKFDVLS